MESKRASKIGMETRNGPAAVPMASASFQKRCGVAIRSKAPLRISFGGGGTDVSPYPEQRGGAVLVASIALYAYSSLRPLSDGPSVITFVENGTAVEHAATDDSMRSGKLQLVKAVVETVGVSQAFEFVFDSDAPPGTGLGSSSTLVVAMLGSLARWRGMGITEYELAELAYYIERERVGFKGGRQDQYAATFGGFNFIEFHRDGVVVNPLRIKDEVLNELQHRLLLCDTGRSRISGSIIDDQIRRYVTGNKETARALDKTKELAYEMKKALLLGRIGELGELLNLGWQHKKCFTEGITNAFIDELYEVACREGAIGGKLLGAGGGGHFLLLCEHENRHRVAQRLEAAGGKIVKFAFDFRGLQTWEGEAT